MADVTGDGVVDLIVGVPGEDAGAGQVVVLPGSTTGLIVASPTVLAQGASGAAGAAEPGDGFGSSLSVGDGLWVGAPGEDLAAATNAGAATRFPIKPLTSKGSVQYRQGARGVPGKPERGDRFGATLGYGGSVIGVPGEDVGRVVDAGIVVWKLKKSISQNSRGVPGRVERGDRFGAAVTAREMFGDNGQGNESRAETLPHGGHRRARRGCENPKGRWYCTPDRRDLRPQTWCTPRSGRRAELPRPVIGSGPPSRSSVGRLSSFDYDEDASWSVHPARTSGQLSNAGAARTVPLYRYCEHGCGSDAYPDDSEAVTMIQGKGHTPGVAGSGNQFGAAVSRLPGVDRAILVGAPGQTVAGKAGAGAVAVLDPVPTGSHQVDQDTRELPGESQAGDRFGTLPSR